MPEIRFEPHDIALIKLAEETEQLAGSICEVAVQARLREIAAELRELAQSATD